MRRFLYILFFVLIVCLVQTSEARKLALLVGVDEYDNVPSLKCCVNDMKALKEALLKIGFRESDIFILTTGGSSVRDLPTKEKIEQKVADILSAAQADDIVFFAFSGHGAREGKTDYFCPPFAKPDNLEGTCVSITKVMEDLSKCEARFKWMVVDACRNDPNNSRDAKAFQVIPAPPQGIALFQSCDKGEKSYEEKREGGNGYFTKNLVAALAGEADVNHDGKLTLFEVCTWTAEQTQAEVEKAEHKTQKPFLNLSVTNFTITEDLNVPKAKALVEEARNAVEEKNYILALQKYDEAIALCPRFNSIRRERTTTQRLLDAENQVKEERKQREDAEKNRRIQEARKRKEEAEKYDLFFPDNFGDKLSAYDPNIPEIQEGLKLLYYNKDVEGALKKFEKARISHPELSPAELALAKYALQFEPQKNGAAARKLIERCVKNHPMDPEAYIFLGDYCLTNGQITEAELLFLQAGLLLKKYQVNAQRNSAMTRQINAGMATVRERRGYMTVLKEEDVTQIAEPILDDTDPQNTGAAQVSDDAKSIPEIQEGLKALQNNDIEGTLKKFDEARKSHPEFSPAELMLAKLALQIHPETNASAARWLIERCVKNNPTDPEAFIYLGDNNLDDGCITEAELLFHQAGVCLKNFKGNAQRKRALIRQYNAKMAMVLERRGYYGQAAIYMETYLHSDPKNVGAMQQLARFYLEMDKPDNAIDMLSKAKAIDNNNLTPEAVVAMFYQQKGDITLAEFYMTKALQKAPRDLNTLLTAAQWAQSINRIDQAITYADAALQIAPKSEAAMLLRGNLALFQKDYGKAIKMYDKILTDSPDSFAASNYIALALCETGNKDDLKRAIEYADKNAQKYSKSPTVFSTLGYVLYKKGEIDNSFKALQKSSKLSGGRMSPDTAYYLSAALVAKGSDECVKRAKEILTNTLDDTPRFMMRPEAEALKAKLDAMRR